MQKGTTMEQKRPKITFLPDKFMEKELKELVKTNHINRSEFIRSAIRDFIRHYTELQLEPYELRHWYEEVKGNLVKLYTFSLSDDIEQEFARLEQVYSNRQIKLNKSLLIRCAIADRILNIIQEENKDD